MVQLGDLSDDCLIEVLDRLPTGQWLKMLRLNRRMNRLTAIKMRVKIKAIRILGGSNPFPCAHLDSISPDQILVLRAQPKPTLKPRRYYDGSDYEFDLESGLIELQVPTTKSVLSLLTKCSGVKSIDFGYLEMGGDFLLEVVRRCPELECVKGFGKSLVEEAEWHRILNQIGNKIVHFGLQHRLSPVLRYPHPPFNQPPFITEVGLLAMVASKCPNIKQVDWIDKVTSDLMAALKMLPKICQVKISPHQIDGPVLDDVVDELDVVKLNWSALGHRYDRLSSLKLRRVFGPDHGVAFAGLKRFEFREFLRNNEESSVDYLIASRFPRLDEFCFNASFTEDDYQALFQKMTSVKKLTIFYESSPLFNNVAHYLPGSSIHQLKNLEIIYLNIDSVWRNKQPDDLLKQIEQYVDEIGSLKKLNLKCRRSVEEWNAKLIDKVEQLKLKQQRVEIKSIWTDY